MSGLDSYLSNLFNECNMRIGEAFNQLPACYGDGIFPQLATILARYTMTDESKQRVNRRLASARQSVGHLFSLHYNTFGLFSIPHRFKLLVNRVEVYKMIFNYFFLLNCYVCFNESPNFFDLRPPTIEEYLPVDQILLPAPIVPEKLLSKVYNYYI